MAIRITLTSHKHQHEYVIPVSQDQRNTHFETFWQTVLRLHFYCNTTLQFDNIDLLRYT